MDDDSSSSKLQLCLTWNSFTDNIINSLESSYGDGDFVDVTLACEGESIKAHKLVLSACSQYLKRLLKENPCPHPIIILKDVGLAELKDLLVYMYHGEVRVEQDRIAKLLHTAQILEIRGLRDISQRLDQDLDSGQVQDSPNVSDAVQNQDTDEIEYNSAKNNGPNNNSTSLRGKSVTLTTKTGTDGETSSSLKPPPIKKSRPVPMLQCIQQSGKADGNITSALHDDKDENEEVEDESNNSSLAPEPPVYPEEIRIKEEIPDIADDFGSFVPNQSSVHDDSSSDAERQRFNNGYSVSPAVIPINTSTISGGFLAAEMLKRVATRASSSESVAPVREAPPISSSGLGSSIPEQGSVGRTQEDSSDEVTVSLLKSTCKRQRSSSTSSAITDTNKPNDSLNFRSWGMMNFSRTMDTRHTIDLTTEKSQENVVEIMDVEALPFTRKTTFRSERHNYLNSRQDEEVEFIRPEYLSKEESGSLRYLDIENTLNINPQLRLQMLMCREYKKYTNILLVAMFGREMLATHSLNGTGTSKPRLDARKVNHIIEAVMTKFGVDQHHVKEAIRVKLNNEDKLKKRLTQKVTSTVVGMQ